MTPRKPVEEHKSFQHKPATPEQLEFVDAIRRRCRLDPADLDRFITDLYGRPMTLADLDRGGVSSLLDRIKRWQELDPHVLKLRGQTSLPL